METTSKSSSSDCSSSDEWADLTKSDYAKVIFSNLSWNCKTGILECLFTLTESVTQNPSDYIGLFKVGFENISQCLISKTVNEMETDNKFTSCLFKSEELPELNGFYQFCYISCDQEVCGASTPIEVKHAKSDICSSNDDVFTEGVEDDFLMVRSRLEKRNIELLAAIDSYQEDKLVLMAKIQELLNEKSNDKKKIEDLQRTIDSDYIRIEQENAIMSSKLDICKKNHTHVYEDLQQLKIKLDEVQIEWEKAVFENKMLDAEVLSATTERDKLATLMKIKEVDLRSCKAKLDVITEENDFNAASIASAENELKRCAANLESVTREKEAFLSKEKQLIKERDDLSKELTDMKLEIKTLKSRFTERVFDTVKCVGAFNEEQRKEKLEIMRLNEECDAYSKRLASLEEKLKKANLEKDIYATELQTMKLFIPESEKLKAKEEELNDAKEMIKALEDSKALVMDELRNSTKMLDKMKNYFRWAKCENLALKIELENRNLKILPSAIFFDKRFHPNYDCFFEPHPDFDPDPDFEQHHDFFNMAYQVFEINSNLLTNKQRAILATEYNDEPPEDENIQEAITNLKNNLDNASQKKMEEINGPKFRVVARHNIDLAVIERLKDAKIELLKECEQICTEATSNMNAYEEKLKKCEEENLGYKKEIENLSQIVTAQKERLETEMACKEESDFVKDTIAKKEEEITILRKKLMEESDFRKDTIAKKEEEITILRKKLMEVSGFEKDTIAKKEKEITILRKKLNSLQIAHANYLNVSTAELKDRNARLMNATEVYKKLYLEKAALAKKLSKITKKKRLAIKSDVSVQQTISQSGSLAVSNEESSSNNSDSDTGEHVRNDFKLLDVSPEVVITEPKDQSKSSSVELSSSSSHATAGNVVDEKLAFQDLSNFKKPESEIEVQNTVLSDQNIVSCSICEKNFPATPLSNTPMLKHYDEEHNVDMCPLCGQLFERTLPRQYIQFHVDTHFRSDRNMSEP